MEADNLIGLEEQPSGVEVVRWSCNECSQSFSSFLELNLHVGKEHTSNVVPIVNCNKISQDSVEVSKHCVEHDNNSIISSVSNKTESSTLKISSFDSKLQHGVKMQKLARNFGAEDALKKKENVPFKCLKCSREFQVFECFQKHKYLTCKGRACNTKTTSKPKYYLLDLMKRRLLKNKVKGHGSNSENEADRKYRDPQGKSSKETENVFNILGYQNDIGISILEGSVCSLSEWNDPVDNIATYKHQVSAENLNPTDKEVTVKTEPNTEDIDTSYVLKQNEDDTVNNSELSSCHSNSDFELKVEIDIMKDIYKETELNSEPSRENKVSYGVSEKGTLNENESDMHVKSSDEVFKHFKETGHEFANGSMFHNNYRQKVNWLNPGISTLPNTKHVPLPLYVRPSPVQEQIVNINHDTSSITTGCSMNDSSSTQIVYVSPVTQEKVKTSTQMVYTSPVAQEKVKTSTQMVYTSPVTQENVKTSTQMVYTSPVTQENVKTSTQIVYTSPVTQENVKSSTQIVYVSPVTQGTLKTSTQMVYTNPETQENIKASNLNMSSRPVTGGKTQDEQSTDLKTAEKHYCFKCNITYLNQDDFLKHFEVCRVISSSEVSKPMTYNCKVCKRSFSVLKSYIKHLEIHKNNRVSLEEKPSTTALYCCNWCSEKFNKRDELLKHFIKCKQMPTSEKESELSSKNKRKLKYEAAYKKRSRTSYTVVKFPYMRSMLNYRIQTSAVPFKVKNNDASHPGSICKKSSVIGNSPVNKKESIIANPSYCVKKVYPKIEKNSVKYDIETVVISDSEQLEEIKDDNDKIFFDDDDEADVFKSRHIEKSCGSEINDGKVEDSQDINTKGSSIPMPYCKVEIERIHICVICFKYFTTVSGLKRHSELHHNSPDVTEPDLVKKTNIVNTKKLLCSVCAEAFSNHSSLIEHEDRCHAKENTENLNVKKRLAKHSYDRREYNFVMCSYCGLPFFSKVQLKAHMKTNHKERYRVLICYCKVCDATFQKREHLAEHSESCVNRWVCAKCQKACESVSNYVLHVRQCSKDFLGNDVEQILISDSEDDEQLMDIKPDGEDVKHSVNVEPVTYEISSDSDESNHHYSDYDGCDVNDDSGDESSSNAIKSADIECKVSVSSSRSSKPKDDVEDDTGDRISSNAIKNDDIEDKASVSSSRSSKDDVDDDSGDSISSNVIKNDDIEDKASVSSSMPSEPVKANKLHQGSAYPILKHKMPECTVELQKIHVCTICFKHFSAYSDLNAHISIDHPDVRIPRHWTDNLSENRNVFIKKFKYNPQGVLKYKHQKLYEEILHRRIRYRPDNNSTNSTQSQTLCYCGVICSNQQEYETHKISCQPGEYKCSKCQKTFLTMLSHQEHMDKCFTHRCIYCDRKFVNNYSDFVKHNDQCGRKHIKMSRQKLLGLKK